MRQKKLKQLRKMAGYDCHADKQYRGKAHGVREEYKPGLVLDENGKIKKGDVLVRKYQAITLTNESKAKYTIAKKTYRALKKTFNQ